MKNKTRALRTWTIAAIVSSALVLTGCGAASGDSDSGAPTEEETSAPAGIGTAVTDGDVEFVVNSVTCSTDPMDDDQFAPLTPSGQFCRVNVSATALDDIGMFLGKITASTSSEADVSPSVGAMMYAGTLSADYIEKGQTLTGDVVFDIPVEDTITSVLLRESALTEGVTVPVS